MKLLLEYGEENMNLFIWERIIYNQFFALSPKESKIELRKKIANFFKLQSTSILMIRSQRWLILAFVY